MKHYIERDLAEKAMMDLEDNDIELYGGVSIPEGFDGKRAVEALRELPTADVEEVRHGKWLFVIGNCKEEIWMCDQCERCIRSERMEKDELIKRYPYCHCGAKMI